MMYHALFVSHTDPGKDRGHDVSCPYGPVREEQDPSLHQNEIGW